MFGLIRGFGIPHNLPAPQRQPPSGPGPAPAPVPDTPPAPAQGHRVKYVVLSVQQAATYHDRRGTPVSTDWHITLRRADQSVPPRYTYYVNQGSQKPCPAATGTTLDLDPRLVDLEPNS